MSSPVVITTSKSKNYTKQTINPKVSCHICRLLGRTTSRTMTHALQIGPLTNIPSQCIKILQNLSKSHLTPWITVGFLQELVGRKRVGNTSHGLTWNALLLGGKRGFLFGCMGLGLLSGNPQLLHDGTFELRDKLERIGMITVIRIINIAIISFPWFVNIVIAGGGLRCADRRRSERSAGCHCRTRFRQH